MSTKSNKIIVALVLISLITAIYAVYTSQKSNELVYVDVNKLIEGYKKTKVVKADFDVKATTMRGNVDSLITGWKKELQAYEKERTILTQKELALKQELDYLINL